MPLPTPEGFHRKSVPKRIALVQELTELNDWLQADPGGDIFEVAEEIGIYANDAGELEGVLNRSLRVFREDLFLTLLERLEGSPAQVRGAIREIRKLFPEANDTEAAKNLIQASLRSIDPTYELKEPSEWTHPLDAPFHMGSSASAPEPSKPTYITSATEEDGERSANQQMGITLLSQLPKHDGYVNTLGKGSPLQQQFLELCRKLEIRSDWENVTNLKGNTLSNSYYLPPLSRRFPDSGSGVELISFVNNSKEGLLAVHLNCWKHRWVQQRADFSVRKNINNAGITIQIYRVDRDDELIATAVVPAVPFDYASNEKRLALLGTDDHFRFSPAGIMRELSKSGIALPDPVDLGIPGLGEEAKALEELERVIDEIEEEDEADEMRNDLSTRFRRLQQKREGAIWGHSLARLESTRGGEFDALFSRCKKDWSADLSLLGKGENFKRLQKKVKELRHHPPAQYGPEEPFIAMKLSPRAWSAGFRGKSR